MKKNKVIISVLLIILMASILLAVKIKHTAAGFGTVTVEITDVSGECIRKVSLEFYEDDTLRGLVENNFNNVVINDGMLMAIENYITPSDWSTYICIYVNDVMSEVGINDIDLKDGDIISFRITELTW